MRTAKLVADADARSVRTLRRLGLSDDSEPNYIGDPQDVWWRLEDLFLRIAAFVKVSVQFDAGGARIVLFGIMQLHDPKLKELRRAAQELRTYGWQTEEARGNFVKTLERQGPTLVCTLASPVQIERWPGGEQLCCDVQRFLVELGHRTLVHGSWR